MGGGEGGRGGGGGVGSFSLYVTTMPSLMIES